jgi:hypothetical protein
MIIIEKGKLELSETEMDKIEEDDLLLKSPLPGIKSLPQCLKRRLRFKFQEFVINEVERAERLLTRISRIFFLFDL